MSPDPIGERVEAVRSFNRFYTRHLGLLNEGILASRFSLTEARVLLEVAVRGTVSASELVDTLGLDAGYLSRILRGFRKQGLVAAERSSEDRRKMLLSLTDEGDVVFSGLDLASRENISGLLDQFSDVDQRRFVEAARVIQDVLLEPECSSRPVVLRAPRAGDFGWIVTSHALLYGREYGFDASFEGLIADIVGRFVRTEDATCERCWIAEMDGRNVGSVVVVRHAETVAQLRLLLVEPDARGFGLGGMLVDEVIAFTRQSGYESVRLWTADHLHAALRIYGTRGFRLIEEKARSSWGHDFVGQTWELAL